MMLILIFLGLFVDQVSMMLLTLPFFMSDGPAGSYSACKKVGNQVFISGTVAWDMDKKPIGGNDAYEQTRIVFGYIKRMMEAAGGKIDDVVQITVFTTDIRYQPEFWRARKEFFTGDFPCSTLVCVSSLFLPEFLIEIEATGIIGSAPR
jgi:2-iminobutanoate/2-iminopropanoate deaminase